MKKQTLILLFFLSLSSLILAQSYQYQSANYAVPNDTFTVSTGNTATLFFTNADTTGEDITWDFTKMTPVTQKPFFYDDPFLLTGYKDQYRNQVCDMSACQSVCLSGCAFAYNPILQLTQYLTCLDTCNKSCKAECDNEWLALTNLAKPLLDSIYTPVGIAITDFYQFSENDNGSLKNTAIGNTIVAYGLEFPMLVRYDNPDVVYSYPVNFGNKDSSESSFKYDLQSMTAGVVPFIWKHWQKRNNEVVGWGKIKTPYGEYDSTYKIKSIVYSVDTIFAASDTFSYGTTLGLAPEQFPDSIIEYTWLSMRSGYPVLKIKALLDLGIEVPLTVEYLDSTRCFVPVPVFIPNPPLAYQNENDSAHIQFYSIPVNTDSLHWDFGDPASGTENISDKWNPIHYYMAKGTYQVTLVTCNTICDTCTTLKIPVKVTDSTEVMADFNFKAAFPCFGDSVRFTNISQRSIAWEWDFNDGSPLNTSRNIAHLFADTGSYNVRLVAWDSTMTMTDTLIKTVTINPKPIPAFSYSDSITHKDILFTNLSTNTIDNSIYFWTVLPNLLGGAVPVKISSFEKEPLFNFDKGGVATVSLMVTNTLGCSAVKSKKITVKECLQAKITASATSVCSGATVSFKNESYSDFLDPVLYYWLKDGALFPMVTDSAYTMSASPGTSAKYIFQLIGDNGMCIDTGTVAINVKKTAKVNAGSDTSLCKGDSVQLNASGGPQFPSFSWTPSQGLSCVDCKKPYAKPLNSTEYILSLSVIPLNTCYMWDTVLVRVDSVAPKAEFDLFSGCSPDLICGFSYTGSSAEKFYWLFNDGISSVEKNPLHDFDTMGFYPVKLTVSNGCGIDSVEKLFFIMFEYVPEKLNVNPKSFNILTDPNPFTNNFSVKLSEISSGKIKLELIDKIGKTVMINECVQNGIIDQFILNGNSLKTLSNGLYILKITTSSGSYWGKVVKME